MKTMNKLVALLLAAVMVLGMMPTMTTHAHAHTVQPLGIEDYPALELGVEFEANIEGTDHYVTFTPELSTQYRFVGLGDGDTKATLYDDQNNVIASADDCYMHEHANSRQFCITAVLEAGKTYVLQHGYYNSGTTGTYNVLVTHEHYYEGTVTVPNTCTTDGVMTYSCACGEGESYTEVIPAAHSYDDEGVCTVCGEVYLLTGECGENLTWEMDWNGNLTIKGTGDMYHYLVSYGGDKYPAPWYDYRDDVTTITVEDGVTSIGNYAFYYCQYATELTLPESVTALGSNSFNSCYGLTEVVLPDGITEIPDSCFYYCGSLADVQWPASLTTIGSNAFNSCSLGDLIVPEGVTTLGQYVFGGNSNLTKLTLPSTLTEVADYAFSRMWNVKDFVFKGDAPTFGGSQVFQWITANAWYPLGNETWTDEVKQSYGGTITWNGICSGSHTWGDPVTVPATCETGSYMTMSCSVCGYTEVSPENDDALGHDYQTEHYDGGCGNSSYDIITCSRCDYYSTENWTWNDHTYEESHVDATCEVGGYDVYTCIYCGYYYEANYTTPLGHDVAEWSEPSEATCTEDGVKTGHCARCDLDVSEVVTPALGHEWDMENGVENEDGSVTYSCIRCDATYTTEGSSLSLGDNQFTIAAEAGSAAKTYTAAENGTLTIYLSDLYYINTWTNDWTTLAIDYAFSEGAFNVYVNDVNTAYTVEGSEIEAHIILDTKTVTAGDVVEVEISHTNASWISNTEVRFNVNLALEVVHTHTEETIPGVPATFDAPGLTEGKKCSECGEILVAQEEIPMLDYNEGIVPIEVLTATAGDWQTGYEATEGPAELVLDDDFSTIWHTNWFGTSRENHWIQFELSESYIVDGLRIKPRQSGGENGIITQYDIQVSDDGENFTSVASGNWEADRTWKEVKFEGQNVKYVRLVALDGVTDQAYVFASAAEIRLTGVKDDTVHEHSYNAVVTAPTCTEGGYTTYTCECGDSYIADYTDALGHTEEIIPAVEATCTETGLTEGKKCSVCGEILVAQEETPALGHDWKGTGCTRCDATRENPFVDVTEDAFYIDPVLWAVEKGITTGVDDTHFNPFGRCDRASVVTFLWRAAGSPEPTTTENPFVDVNEAHFYYKAVLWAVEEGITNGTSATTFAPFAKCTRAQVVTFLYRALGEPEVASTESGFTDVTDPKLYFYAPVLWAVENGITNGVGDGSFGINKICDRAQVVTFLYRAYVK